MTDRVHSSAVCIAPTQTLTVGIGCRRGLSARRIEDAVRGVLGGVWPMHAVSRVATIEAKAGEPALVQFCARHRLPLLVFSADEINACVAAHASLHRSPSVRAHLRVDGVCEPCALLASPGARLLVSKRVFDGVTIALAASTCASTSESAMALAKALAMRVLMPMSKQAATPNTRHRTKPSQRPTS